MTTLRTYRSKETVRLTAKPLASGGEGSVFETSRPGTLAKLFHRPMPSHFQKLGIMLSHPPKRTGDPRQHCSLAWPIDLLVKPSGALCGFLMPKIKGGAPLLRVCNTQSRRQFAPGFNWRYLHAAALNFALCMRSLHAQGYIVGDIRTENVLVNPCGLVTLIDLDSIQVKEPRSGRLFVCTVGTEGFTPPELLQTSVDFSITPRSEVHDRFGMAVVIHYLLLGYHPFQFQWSGAGEAPALNQIIGRGGWKSRRSGGDRAVSLGILHPTLRAQFTRCFEKGHSAPAQRPSAQEWIEALRESLTSLDQCSANPNHFYSKECGGCVWCQRQSAVGTDSFAGDGNASSGSKQSVRRVPRVNLGRTRLGKIVRRCPGCSDYAIAILGSIKCKKCQAYVHSCCLRNGSRRKAGFLTTVTDRVCPGCGEVLHTRTAFRWA